MAISWTKNENAQRVVFVSSQGVTITVQKTPVNTFDMRVAGPFTILAGAGGPGGDSSNPATFIANFIKERRAAGDTIS